MAAKTDYSAGIATVANGGTTVTFSGGANITAADIQPGDSFHAQNLFGIIATVTDATHVELTAPWTGTALAAAPYRIRYQPDGSRFTAALRDLVTSISNGAVAALQALTPSAAANKLPYFNSSSTMDLTDLSSFARTLLDDANAATVYATLGVVPNDQLPARISASSSSEFSANANNILETGFYSIGSAASNNPTGTTGLIINIRQVVGYARQLFFERDGTRTYSRNLVNSVWNAWVETTSDTAGTGRSTAALGVNDIGSYIFGNNQQSAAIGTGATVNGLNLRFAKITPAGAIATNASTQSGSWMSCNASKLDTESNVSGVYKRIL